MDKIINTLKKYYKGLEDEMTQEIMKIIQNELDNMARAEIKSRTESKREEGKTDSQKINNEIYNEFHGDVANFIKLTPEKQKELENMANEQIAREKPYRSHIKYLLDCLISHLEIPKPKLYLEFDKLSEILQYIAFPINMQIELLTHILKNNEELSADVEEPLYMTDTTLITDYDYKYISKERLLSIIRQGKLTEFLECDNPEESEARKEVQEHYDKTKVDMTSFLHASNKLFSLITKNVKDLTEEDYQTIVDIMDQLSFDYLSHRIIKQLKKNADELSKLDFQIKEPKKEKIIPLKPTIPQKKINQVHYEISKLYDLDKFKEKKTLSLDEIIYILSLMYSIAMDEKVIYRFLESAMHAYYKNNPFCIFYQSYDKFKSIDDEEVQEHLSMIEYMLSEVNIFICSEMEYQETKKLVKEELDAIINILSSNYDYEINKAKALLKKEEGDNNGRSN